MPIFTMEKQLKRTLCLNISEVLSTYQVEIHETGVDGCEQIRYVILELHHVDKRKIVEG